MKKLRVDQKIIVIAYALDLLMPFLISYGTYKAYEMTKLMYLASQLGIICWKFYDFTYSLCDCISLFKRS